MNRNFKIAMYFIITILVIVIDCIFGTYLMKNNIMSYDAIIGARYYGVGNEYEGVSIASPIFAFAILLNYNKKLPKWSIIIASIVSLPNIDEALYLLSPAIIS